VKVIISRQAEADIEEIALFLAAHGLPTALRFEKGVRDVIRKLDLFPKRYPPVEENPNLRRALFQRWSIIYSIIESEQVVWIERVMR